jgi:hypothetical protein
VILNYQIKSRLSSQLCQFKYRSGQIIRTTSLYLIVYLYERQNSDLSSFPSVDIYPGLSAHPKVFFRKSQPLFNVGQLVVMLFDKLQTRQKAGSICNLDVESRTFIQFQHQIHTDVSQADQLRATGCDVKQRVPVWNMDIGNRVASIWMFIDDGVSPDSCERFSTAHIDACANRRTTSNSKCSRYNRINSPIPTRMVNRNTPQINSVSLNARAISTGMNVPNVRIPMTLRSITRNKTPKGTTKATRYTARVWAGRLNREKSKRKGFLMMPFSTAS